MHHRTIRLVERQSRCCRLPRATVDFLLAHFASVVHLQPIDIRHYYRLTATGRVGAICAPQCTIVIRSKVPITHFWEEAASTGPASTAPPSVASVSAPGLALASASTPSERIDALEITAWAVLQAAEAIIRRGPSVGYREETASTPLPQGRIDWAQQRNEAFRCTPNLPIFREDLSRDQVWNRLACAIVGQVAAWPGLSEPTRHRLEEVLRSLRHAVTEVPDLASFTPTDWQTLPADLDAQADYRRLWELGRSVREAHICGSQVLPIGSVLLDLERLFERYMVRVLRRWASAEAQVVEQPRFRWRGLSESASLELRPDVLLRRSDGSEWIIDAKWKRFAGVPNLADVHQVLAYAAGFGLPRVGLVLPARRTRLGSWHSPRSAVRFFVHGLRVDGSQAQRERSARRWVRILIATEK